MKQRWWVALTVILLAGDAYGGILFEPYGGYGQGQYTFNFNSLPDDAGKVSGSVVGARLGMTFVKFFLAADVSQQTLKFRGDGGSTTDDDGKLTSVYGTIGWDTPWLRLWAAYSVMDTLEIKEPVSGDQTYTGDSYKVGLGVRLVSQLYLNLEYAVHNPKKLKLNGTDYNVASNFSKCTFNGISATLSFPFRF